MRKPVAAPSRNTRPPSRAPLKPAVSERLHANTGPGKLVPAVVNASKILRFLRAAPHPATVTQITRQLGLNPSTCFNILRTLLKEDLVHFDPHTKTYTVGLGIVALAKGALDQSMELQILQPKLEALAQRHEVMATVWLPVSDNRTMLVAVAESDAPIRIHARIGTRQPMLLGASGRVFTAFLNLDIEELRRRFSELRLARRLDFETYLEQLSDVRESGWAIDDGYAYAGTITVAAPVFEPNGVLRFSCSATLFNGQYDLKRIQAIAAELREIGRTFIGASSAGDDSTRESKVALRPRPA